MTFASTLLSAPHVRQGSISIKINASLRAPPPLITTILYGFALTVRPDAPVATVAYSALPAELITIWMFPCTFATFATFCATVVLDRVRISASAAIRLISTNKTSATFLPAPMENMLIQSLDVPTALLCSTIVLLAMPALLCCA